MRFNERLLRPINPSVEYLLTTAFFPRRIFLFQEGPLIIYHAQAVYSTSKSKSLFPSIPLNFTAPLKIKPPDSVVQSRKRETSRDEGKDRKKGRKERKRNNERKKWILREKFHFWLRRVTSRSWADLYWTRFSATRSKTHV